MPRIPYLRDEEVGPEDVVVPIRQRRGGKLLNLDRELLYSPPLALGWNHLLGAIRTRLSVSAQLRELAMCGVAVLNDAPYEFIHHAPELIKAGGTQAQVDALFSVENALQRTDLFNRCEIAVLRLTYEMTRNVKVAESTFSELLEALGDDRHAVELVSTVAAYNMVSRVIVALQVEPEAREDAGHSVADERLHLSSRVNVPGAAIAYSIDGPAEAPILMLSSGLAADMSIWDGVLERLSSKYRVLRYDMRGHGSSSTPPGNYSIAVLADDVIALMDALKLPRVHFLGVGLGGMIGQQLGVRYPNRINGLVLCSTPSEQAESQAWSERMVQVRAGGIASIADATLARWFTPEFMREQPKVVANMRSMFLKTRADSWLACASVVRDLAQTALLSKIQAPTLLISGASDAAAAPEVLQKMSLHIRNARVYIEKDAAHLPHVERPDAFCRTVLEFISYVDRSSA